MFLWWPSFKIQFKSSWCIKTTWPLRWGGCVCGVGVGWGRAIKFIQNSYSSELGWNFNSKYANLFAQVSDIGPSWSSCYVSNSLRGWGGMSAFAGQLCTDAWTMHCEAYPKQCARNIKCLYPFRIVLKSNPSQRNHKESTPFYDRHLKH